MVCAPPHVPLLLLHHCKCALLLFPHVVNSLLCANGVEELVSAVKTGDVERVRELVSSGSDINMLDDTGSPLLHCAVYSASCTIYAERADNVIKYLVDAGCTFLLSRLCSSGRGADVVERRRCSRESQWT